MPKKAVSAHERQNIEFMAALRAGQIRAGERDIDTAHHMPDCQWRAYYNRLKNPGKFTVEDLRVLAKRYNFTDYQLCQIIGVKYNGQTLHQEAV